MLFEIVLKKNQQYYIGFNDGQIPGFGLSSTNPVISNLFVFCSFHLTAKIPPDPTNFEKCCVASQGCLLLLYLKQHLKEMYGFSDR